MKLRVIILLLALLALLSALIGGYVHYTSLRNNFLNDVEQRAQSLSAQLGGRLDSYLVEQLKPVRALAGILEIKAAVANPNAETINAANRFLDHFKQALGVDVCYIMDFNGVTLASSNRAEPDSFMGKSFAFRPYFTEAINFLPAIYMALGTTSNRRGIYYSHPIYEDGAEHPDGVVVIKAPVEPMEERLAQIENGVALLVDPNGIIFVSSDPSWLNKSLRSLTRAEEERVRGSLQFGKGPWQWTGITTLEEGRAVDRDGVGHLIIEKPVAKFPGWKLTLLFEAQYDYLSFIKPIFSKNRSLVVPLLIAIFIAVIVLYKTANIEVVKRRRAEEALRHAEEQFRSLYNKTPAMLHSIDETRALVRVSDHWAEVLGYTREEVLGRRVTEFMTDESRKYAEELVIPTFMETGFCKDVAYQLKKKNGEVVDVLLSAIAERDVEGNIKRSLSVLVDVTELKRVERTLKSAQDMLQNYSRDLERQVRERAQEVSNILKYTPAVVSLKDNEGRYLVVNSRFEELFGVGIEQLRGKTDMEMFPEKVAATLHERDMAVLEAREPISSEETIPKEGQSLTYLSLRFPLFDENGEMTGVGSVSTDVTALKEATEKLRQLSKRIVESQERERAAISRELHDELGQVMTAMKMDAAWLVKHLGGVDAKGAARASAMSDMIDSTIEELRNIVTRLRPGVLDDLGLIAALEWVTTEFERRHDISCTFKHNEVPEVVDAAATAIYRIAQEALTNVARHSDASRAEVMLELHGDEIVLTVEDDGKGADIKGLEEAEGFGISGIRERASLIGGTVELNSDVGTGMKLVFRMELDTQERNAPDRKVTG